MAPKRPKTECPPDRAYKPLEPSPEVKRLSRTPEDTIAAKQRLIEAVAEVYKIEDACRVAGVAKGTFYYWRDHDPKFAAAVEKARDQVLYSLEEELRQRCTKGVKQEVYQGGRYVGDITIKSDKLLMFMLRSLNPEKYGEKRDAPQEGNSGPKQSISFAGKKLEF